MSFKGGITRQASSAGLSDIARKQYACKVSNQWLINIFPVFRNNHDVRGFAKHNLTCKSEAVFIISDCFPRGTVCRRFAEVVLGSRPTQTPAAGSLYQPIVVIHPISVFKVLRALYRIPAGHPKTHFPTLRCRLG